MIKTATLQTAKLLKESGFKQDTYFVHYLNKHEDTAINTVSDRIFYPSEYWDEFPSPTTDELLEELPYAININKGPFEYRVSYHIVARVDNISFLDKSLSEALAKMYLWLKKEKLI